MVGWADSTHKASGQRPAADKETVVLNMVALILRDAQTENLKEKLLLVRDHKGPSYMEN